MKRIFIIVVIILLCKFTSGQSGFSKCYDTLHRHLITDTVLKGNVFADWENCIRGKQMPYLSVETISGEKVETQKLKGKVLMINLWFMACHPCIAELPALNHLVKEYKGKDVVFLGLCTDTKDRLDSDFLPKYKFDFVIVPDALDVIRKIGQTGYPTTYIIDKKGNVQAVWNGGSINEKAETEAYLKAKPIIDELLKAE
jgi:thiol-disulfide isomerase/thioredoxin